MKYIDLHVHSSCSDGTFSPSEVVSLAVQKNLSAIALTDHDTVDGILEATNTALDFAKKDSPIEIIAGTELSVSYQKHDIHILGLFLDTTNKSLLASLETAQQERIDRNLKMIKNLSNDGINISFEQLCNGQTNCVITRAHFAKVLAENGYCKTFKDAFVKYLAPSGAYYVKRKYFSPKDAISIIKDAGGIPILAHPLIYKFANDELDLLVKSLANIGLQGIETIYSSNIGFDEGYVRKLANRYNLAMTGGSDFHGSNKPFIDIGIGKGNLKIPESFLDTLKGLL